MPVLYNRIGDKYDTTRKADLEILHTLRMGSNLRLTLVVN